VAPMVFQTHQQARERITPVRITDQGCMMRGYARSVVTALNQTREVNTFIPALASLYAMRPIEVPIAHEERFAGKSKYSMYSLIRLNFDLITGFSVVPYSCFPWWVWWYRFFPPCWCCIYSCIASSSGGSGRFVHSVRIMFFLVGVALFGIGLLGEYVGRIYAQVRERPRYIVEAVLETATPHPRRSVRGGIARHRVARPQPGFTPVTRAWCLPTAKSEFAVSGTIGAGSGDSAAVHP